MASQTNWLNIIDQNGNSLFSATVPYIGVNVQSIMENAYKQAQSPATPDPFEFTVTYFGNSQNPQFPAYLGYEIESLCHLPSNAQFYWSLLINSTPSASGADTTYPNPGDIVAWQYTAIPAQGLSAHTRAHEIHKQRVARLSAKNREK